MTSLSRNSFGCQSTCRMQKHCRKSARKYEPRQRQRDWCQQLMLGRCLPLTVMHRLSSWARAVAASFPNNLSFLDFSFGMQRHGGDNRGILHSVHSSQSSRIFGPFYHLPIIIRALFRDQIWFYLWILFSRKAPLKGPSPPPPRHPWVSHLRRLMRRERAKRGVGLGH